MSFLRPSFWLVFVVAFSLPLLCQSPQSAPADPAQSQQAAPAETQSPDEPQPQGPPPGSHRAHPRPTPCWRVAGLSPEIVNQRWKIDDDAKTKISAVCTDNALSAQQKTDKIHQINAEKDQEFAKITPADKLATLNTCQAQRDRENAARPGTAKKELGPCGGSLPTVPAAGAHAHEHPAANPKQ